MEVAPGPANPAWMEEALLEAELAGLEGEVPVGAVVVYEGAIIARAHNRKEAWNDPCAHAEILAIREAAHKLSRWRLWGCTLVVTLEPCPMCAGAIVHSRLDRLVYGAPDPRTGAAGSVMDIVREPTLNHRALVEAGVLASRSSQLLTSFFAKRRSEQKLKSESPFAEYAVNGP